MKRCFWKKKQAPPRFAGAGPWAHPATGTAPFGPAPPALATAEADPQAEAAPRAEAAQAVVALPEDAPAAAALLEDPAVPENPDFTIDKRKKPP